MRTPRPNRRLGPGIVLTALLVVLTGCSSVEITLPPSQTIDGITFHPSLNIDLAAMTELPIGIYIEEVEEGDGAVAEELQTVQVRWSGFLATSGRQFIADQAGIILGVGEVPAGLDHTIRGMKVGGIRRSVVPPELGYGPVTRGPVPGGSVLVYEVELIDIFQQSSQQP